MILPLPQGFTPPENARPGEAFEVVATVKANEDGSFELLAIDGMEVGKSETPAKEDAMSRFAAKVKLPWDES